MMKGGSSSNLNPESPVFIPSSFQHRLYHIPSQPFPFTAPETITAPHFPLPPPPPSFPANPPSLYHLYYTHYSLPPPEIINTHLPPLPSPVFQSQQHYPEHPIQESPSTTTAWPSHQLQTDYFRQALTPVTSGTRFRPNIVVGPRRNKKLIIQPERSHINDENFGSNSMERNVSGKMIGRRNKFVWETKKTAHKEDVISLREDEQTITTMAKNNRNERVMERNVRDKMIGGRNKFVRPIKKTAGKKDVIPLREDEQKTTIMIKNIPNEYTREMLLQLLGQHCNTENERAKELISAGIEMVSAYDFVYLPIDFWSRQNKGYAFVNFTNPNAVWKFYDVFNETSWDLFKSKKIIEIVSAKIQGKEGLVSHFGRSNFCCETDEYLPLWLDPPSDGSGKPVKLQTVGNRHSSIPTRMAGWIQQKSIIR